MTTRGLIQILGPVTTFIGVAISIWGTYLLTRWYHTFRPKDFLQVVFSAAFLVLTGRKEKALRFTRTTAKFGRLNREKRAESLIGIYLLFVGFILQAIGAFCWGTDAIWSLVSSSHSG